MKKTDINRIRYEVERQVFQAIDKELEELNIIFVKRANQYHQLLCSKEAINIVDHTYGPRFRRLDLIRSRLKMKEIENWNASGEILKRQYENRIRWIDLKLDLEVEE